jgi:hypothetical protein
MKSTHSSTSTKTSSCLVGSPFSFAIVRGEVHLVLAVFPTLYSLPSQIFFLYEKKADVHFSTPPYSALPLRVKVSQFQNLYGGF